MLKQVFTCAFGLFIALNFSTAGLSAAEKKVGTINTTEPAEEKSNADAKEINASHETARFHAPKPGVSDNAVAECNGCPCNKKKKKQSQLAVEESAAETKIIEDEQKPEGETLACEPGVDNAQVEKNKVETKKPDAVNA